MPNSQKSQDIFADFPLSDADSCVKCGLCLPHCPTYVETGSEGDSPRGRIALMQGLAQGALEPAGRTLDHLDGCLTCRACESVCPANVPYGHLIDSGRQGLWNAGHRPGWRWRVLAWWRATPARIKFMGRLLRILDASGLRRLATALPLRGAARAASLAGPAHAWPATGIHPARGEHRGEVALFLGCIARPLDGDVAHAAVRILTTLGYEVHVPAGQGCCGAMDQHAGDGNGAAAHMKRNQGAFGGQHVLSTASGCGIQLAEHSTLDVEDAAGFIARALRDSGIRLEHREERILLHSPCTLQQMRAADGVRQLLEQLPGATIQSLPHRHCCGAAGAYLFEQPAMSEKLGDATWSVVEMQDADVLATSNIGCALQLRFTARKHGSHLPARHPLQIVADRLPAR